MCSISLFEKIEKQEQILDRNVWWVHIKKTSHTFLYQLWLFFNISTIPLTTFLTMHFPMISKLTILFSVTMSRSSKILTTVKFQVYFCYNIDSLNLVKLSILQTLLTSTRYVVLSVPICVSDLKTQLLIKTFSDRKLFLLIFCH